MSLSSQSSNPSTPPSVSITGNPALDGLILKGIGALAVVLATWATTHLKLSDPAYAEYLTFVIAGGLALAATTIWGFINSKLHQAEAVRAGMNLAITGNAIMQDTGEGTVVPAPVTTKTASQIVKDFGKVTAEVEPQITDALNKTQLK